jgi:molybdate transport system substrate-binding protein
MNKLTRMAAVAAVLTAALPLAACGSSDNASGGNSSTGSTSGSTSDGSGAGKTLTVFAAASLTQSFTAIGKAFEAAHPGTTVRFSFGGSSDLVAQIQNGAPADVFASADLTQMKIAQDKGLIASRPAVFARNRLVVIVPRNNPGHVYRVSDLGRPGVRLVLAAPQVPVGKYARAALAAMAHDVAFGPHFLARTMANVVSNETDVKAVVAKVVLGEADAGVVYVTDVTAQVAPRVHTIAIPARFNQIAQYPIAVVKGSRNPALARTFVAYVLSPAGQSVLRRSGFISGDRGWALGVRGPLTPIPYRLSPIVGAP